MFIIHVRNQHKLLKDLTTIEQPEKSKYETTGFTFRYKPKRQLMTAAETRFFHMLMRELGGDYYIFPQVRISAIIDHKMPGQNWVAALWHINSKSVDYVVCDKNTNIKAAIELDDYTHKYNSRKKRDAEVERIFREAPMKLIRVSDMTNDNVLKIKSILQELY